MSMVGSNREVFEVYECIVLLVTIAVVYLTAYRTRS